MGLPHTKYGPENECSKVLKCSGWRNATEYGKHGSQKGCSHKLTFMKKTGDVISNGVQHNLGCYARYKLPFPQGADVPPSSAVLDCSDAIRAYLVDAATDTMHASS